METNHEDRWVNSRLATLEPQWQPDFARGRNLLDAGLARPNRSLLWVTAATVGVLCIAALAIPQTRAFAQQLWYRLVLGRVDVIRVDFSDLPLDIRVTANGAPVAAQDVDDAERKGGFKPHLPSNGVPRASPDLTVIGLLLAEQTIDVREIETALRNVGAGDVRVPPEWDGVRLRAEVGPIVSANYADEVMILQARPIDLSVPSGFPLKHFAEVAFRSFGVTDEEAKTLARKFVDDPAWFLDIPAGEVVNIEEVSLRAGPGLLIEDFADNGELERVTVLRSTNERIYSVSAKSREVSLKVADALP